jgi:hypothetical protein
MSIAFFITLVRVSLSVVAMRRSEKEQEKNFYGSINNNSILINIQFEKNSRSKKRLSLRSFYGQVFILALEKGPRRNEKMFHLTGAGIETFERETEPSGAGEEEFRDSI